jgi:DNA-binding protein
VSGDFGHLNNQQALAMLNSLGDDLPQVVIAGHISEQNNAIDVVESLLEPMISSTDLTVIYATQSQGFDWVSPKSDDDISRVA